jgi:hypothetical protein
LYNLVLGNGKICSPNNISDINEFNNHKKVYSIGFRKIIEEKPKEVADKVKAFINKN